MAQFRETDVFRMNHPLGAIAEFAVGNRKGLLLWTDDHLLHGRGNWAFWLLRPYLWPETYPDWKEESQWYGLLIDMLAKADTGHPILIFGCSQKISAEQAAEIAGGQLVDEGNGVDEQPDTRDGLQLETLETPFPISDTGLHLGYDREGCEPILVESHRLRRYRRKYGQPWMICSDQMYFQDDADLDYELLAEGRIPHLNRPGILHSGILDRPFLTLGRVEDWMVHTVHTWQGKESAMPISFGCSHIPRKWLYTLDAAILPSLLALRIIEVVAE